MAAIISRELLEGAVRLHGHLGPFLVLGLKMGLRANRILGEKPEKCKVETINSKPFLCVVDGIKAVRGINSVTVREGDGLVANFSGLNSEKVTVRVKKTVIKKYAEGSWERNEEYAFEVIRSDEEQLFE